MIVQRDEVGLATDMRVRDQHLAGRQMQAKNGAALGRTGRRPSLSPSSVNLSPERKRRDVGFVSAAS